MHVVVTAGHVDHGKSTLVRALTGTDPDRLEEERRRGLSIELGYAWTSLADVGEVAFVDVPGHERFIATTLSGMGPVPVAMLVVAADDPWMPQAAEHLAALDALGVSHGLVVVTRADLASPEPALARARTEVDRTSLAGAPVLAVSARTGLGMDDLRTALVSLLDELPSPAPDADVRLWVDRRFHVRGTGTVVTGTLSAGTIAVGDVLALGEETVRVRGVESLGVARPSVSGVARVALDLGGRAPTELTRGDALVTPGAFEPATVVDVRLSGEGDVPAKPLLHVGSALVPVHARPLGDSFVRLTLERALPLRVGDRAILRDPGSRALWGVRVLDPAPPSLRRRGAAAARAAALLAHDGSVAAELDVRGVARLLELRRLGFGGPVPDDAVAVGDWLVAHARAAELRSRLAALASARPVAPAQAAHELGLPDPSLVLALVEPPLRVEGGRVTAGSVVPEALRRAAAAVCAETDGFAAVEAGRLNELGLGAAELGRLHQAGLLLRIDPKVALPPGSDDRAVEVLRELEQPFTTSAARQALGSSRRVVLPLLAHLDRTGRTVRLADDRRRLR